MLSSKGVILNGKPVQFSSTSIMYGKIYIEFTINSNIQDDLILFNIRSVNVFSGLCLCVRFVEVSGKQ